MDKDTKEKAKLIRKRLRHRGITKYILELVATNPKGVVTSKDLVSEVQKEYSDASYQNVMSAMHRLKEDGKVIKLPRAKGDRRHGWSILNPADRQSPMLQSSPLPALEEQVISSRKLGEAVIEAIQGMKKRISQQEQRILSLENTIRNMTSSHSHEVKRLNDQVSEKQGIIINLRKRIQSESSALTFSLSDVSEYRKENPR